MHVAIAMFYINRKCISTVVKVIWLVLNCICGCVNMCMHTYVNSYACIIRILLPKCIYVHGRMSTDYNIIVSTITYISMIIPYSGISYL